MAFMTRSRVEDRMGRRAPVRTMRRSTGFTLVELMVVIVIIGLASAAVVLAMPDSGGSVQAEAERFAARAKAARDSAIVESRPVLLQVDSSGYSISRRGRGDWTVTGRHEWADGTDMDLSGSADGSIRFDSTGLADPALLTLRRNGGQVAVQVGQDGEIHVRR